MTHETKERADLGFVMANEYGLGKRPHVFQKVVPGPRAMYALQLAERWGMVAGMMDGEDPAGRAKVRLATIPEVVDRACECADAMFTRFDELGWTLELPDPEVRPEREQ